MTRKELISHLSRCAALGGYPFTTGLAYRINTELADTPMLWADPPVMLRKIGRGEGSKEYRIVLRMIDLPESGEGNEDYFATMEDAFSPILALLSDHDDVAGMKEVEYIPEENTLTNRGEVSLKAVFTLITKF